MPFDTEGPLHARRYTDKKGRVWTYDATTLDHEGHACYRSGELSVRGPNLTAERDLDTWAQRLENAPD